MIVSVYSSHGKKNVTAEMVISYPYLVISSHNFVTPPFLPLTNILCMILKRNPEGSRKQGMRSVLKVFVLIYTSNSKSERPCVSNVYPHYLVMRCEMLESHRTPPEQTQKVSSSLCQKYVYLCTLYKTLRKAGIDTEQWHVLASDKVV